MEKLYTVIKKRPGADCGSDHELLIAKYRLILKTEGKTTRPFRYDINQIPYDYTVEVTIFVLDPVLIIYSATSFRHFFLSPFYHKVFTLWLVIFITIIHDVIFFIRKKVFHWYCLVSLLPFNVKSPEEKIKEIWISAYFKRKRLVNTLFRGKKRNA